MGSLLFVLCSFKILFPYYCCTGGMLWHLQKSLQFILIKFIPSIILLYPLSPILRILSTGLLFHFHVWEHMFPPHALSYTLSLYLHPPTDTNPQTGLVFWWYGVWSQGLTLSSQVLSHALAFSASVYFSDRFSCFFLGLILLSLPFE
jgi:hypothetical protein